jgi:hypothetical protein
MGVAIDQGGARINLTVPIYQYDWARNQENYESILNLTELY